MITIAVHLQIKAFHTKEEGCNDFGFELYGFKCTVSGTYGVGTFQNFCRSPQLLGDPRLIQFYLFNINCTEKSFIITLKVLKVH